MCKHLLYVYLVLYGLYVSCEGEQGGVNYDSLSNTEKLKLKRFISLHRAEGGAGFDQHCLYVIFGRPKDNKYKPVYKIPISVLPIKNIET